MEKRDIYLEKYTVVAETSWWEGFKRAIYNSREKTVFFRTKQSWGKILLFYLCFYGCLAGFFAICLGVFLSTVPPSDKGPKYTMLNLNPGLVATPASFPPPEVTVNNALSVSRTQIRELLSPYTAPNREPFECGSGNTCNFDISTLGECGRSPNYGFFNETGKKTGCAIIAMNRVWNWVPEVANTNLDYVPVNCNPIKDENLAVKPVVNVINMGFTRSFYPWTGQANYLKPLVAVQFDGADLAYEIHCRLNATNVEISPAPNKLFEAQVFIKINRS